MGAENKPKVQDTPPGFVKIREVVTSTGKVIQTFVPKKRRR